MVCISIFPKLSSNWFPFNEARISEWNVYDQMLSRGWFDPQVVLPHLEASLYFDCIGHIILLCSKSANKQKMIYH